MIVVDTNVISELWRLAPDPRVLAWMDAQAIETLHLSAVTVADLDAAKAYADLMASAKTQGKAIARADGYIAATAMAHGLMVATRDTSPFEAGGLETINPWTAAP
jgi:predicted nucleic acid-binding protein